MLQTLLKEWKKDPLNKVLIFTKYVKLLEMLDFHLNSQGWWSILTSLFHVGVLLPSLGEGSTTTTYRFWQTPAQGWVSSSWMDQLSNQIVSFTPVLPPRSAVVQPSYRFPDSIFRNALDWQVPWGPRCLCLPHLNTGRWNRLESDGSQQSRYFW